MTLRNISLSLLSPSKSLARVTPCLCSFVSLRLCCRLSLCCCSTGVGQVKVSYPPALSALMGNIPSQRDKPVCSYFVLHRFDHQRAVGRKKHGGDFLHLTCWMQDWWHRCVFTTFTVISCSLFQFTTYENCSKREDDASPAADDQDKIYSNLWHYILFPVNLSITSLLFSEKKCS